MAENEGKYRGTKDYALVYAELITAAKYRGTVTYQELAKIMGLPMRGSHLSRQIGTILGEISEDEVARERPMLSAIAVGVQGLPGPGFYTLARNVGRLTEQDEQTFWEAESQAVYEAWKVELREK